MAKTDAELLEDCCRIELEDRTAEELDGAYTALCEMVLLKTSLALRGPRAYQEASQARVRAEWRHASRWLDGHCGVWTFQTVCDALDMNPDFARQRLVRYAAAERARPISSPATRKVFGRDYTHAHARPETSAPY